MTFKDIFKNGFLDNFMNGISFPTVTVTLTIAFIFSILIYFIYLFTCDKTTYSKKFNISMCLMTIITSAVVLSMQANIVVSLGMVGSLSIVRYRSAIKEPRDLVFVFWSVCNGIIIGAGIYSIAIILLLMVAFSLFLFNILPGIKKPLMLVINFNNIKTEKLVNEIFKKYKICFSIKSKSINKNNISIIYEINCKDEENLISELNKLNDISSINLLIQ